MAKTAKTVTICDMCRDALYDFMPSTADTDDAMIVLMLVEMGSEIADHLCEKREYGSPCECGCNHR